LEVPKPGGFFFALTGQAAFCKTVDIFPHLFAGLNLVGVVDNLLLLLRRERRKTVHRLNVLRQRHAETKRDIALSNGNCHKYHLGVSMVYLHVEYKRQRPKSRL
jgi:hypothetical protein